MRPRPPLAVPALALVLACATPVRWEAPDAPTPREAELLLRVPSVETLVEVLPPTGIPEIPVRRRLRPCCAFGANLGVRLGPVPVPGLRLLNVRELADLGPHHYDAGVLPIAGGSRGEPLAVENNGLVYTCHGGFVDVAHVRDYADWTTYLAAWLLPRLRTGGEVELPAEGGARRVVLERVPDVLLREAEPQAIALALAQHLAFGLSVWHEIATWYGWSWSPAFPEVASAFSPEDLYSNLLGTRIAVAVAAERSARTAELYERSVDNWLRAVLQQLGATSRETALEAMWAVDGSWWRSEALLPDGDLVIRRNLDLGPVLRPWQVPRERRGSELRARLAAECPDGEDPTPLRPIRTLRGIPLGRLARLEIEVDPKLRAQPALAAEVGVLTDRDLPRLVAVIREEVRARFGPTADRPTDAGAAGAVPERAPGRADQGALETSAARQGSARATFTN